MTLTHTGSVLKLLLGKLEYISFYRIGGLTGIAILCCSAFYIDLTINILDHAFVHVFYSELID